MSEIKPTTTPIPEHETAACSCCGTVYPLSELTLVECYLYCSDCIDRETVVCNHCSNRIIFDDNAGNEDSLIATIISALCEMILGTA